MGAAITVILLKERQVIAAFKDAGAIAPDRALDPRDIRVDRDGLIWRRLRERAIIRESESGLFYFDEEVWNAQRRARLRLVTVLLIIVAIVGAALFTARGRFQ
jgi:hypothetical protein